MRLKINGNIIAIIILTTLYAISIGRYLELTTTQGEAGDDETNKKVIRLAHWHLEVGYRDGLQWAMDEYNKLPHVKEANVEVVQLGITERVYNQFMNVHLISGTAPDIAGKGKTTLIKGNAVARFYSPLSNFINEPNPYNARKYQKPGLSRALSEYLETQPFSQTFLDEMAGGYDESLNDYYAFPISTWGSLRIFYNLNLLKEGKQFILEALNKPTEPAWLSACWIREVNGEQQGFLPKSERLYYWLGNNELPETLGQLILYCEAILEFAKANKKEYLVPISGSNYGPSNLARDYRVPFLSHYAETIDTNADHVVDPLETLNGWKRGDWSFHSPEVKAYHELSAKISSYFPTGFLGLDRAQAQRRFVSGNAAMISSGGWDASSIFTSVAKKEFESDRFPIAVAPSPIPAEDERWAEYIKATRIETDVTTGSPMALNKQSKNFTWALDFIKFLCSHRINEEFNARTGWLPSIVGTTPIDAMKGFTPSPEGIPRKDALNFASSVSSVKTVYSGQFKLLVSGDIDYDTFVNRITEILENEQLGVNRQWRSDLQKKKDNMRATDRSLSVEFVNTYIQKDEKATSRLKSNLLTSLKEDEGTNILFQWNKQNPNKPFPTN